MPDTNYLCCQMFCLPCNIETHCQGLVCLCCAAWAEGAWQWAEVVLVAGQSCSRGVLSVSSS